MVEFQNFWLNYFVGIYYNYDSSTSKYHKRVERSEPIRRPLKMQPVPSAGKRAEMASHYIWFCVCS